LNRPECRIEVYEGMDINDAGHIMGTGFDSWREPYLSAGPVPEPETYTMMLAGLLLVGATPRQRRMQFVS
jgi:hypothetical protein